MNDPCAPGYDPKMGLYHLFYQWTPHSHQWNKIAWGHATSKDLLYWTHDSPEVSPVTRCADGRHQPSSRTRTTTGREFSPGASGPRGCTAKTS